MIRKLLKLSSGRLLLLAGDKAFCEPEEMQHIGIAQQQQQQGQQQHGGQQQQQQGKDPHIAIHGSFSMMANFDAIRRYFEQRGGFALHTPYHDGFKMAAFIINKPTAAAAAGARGGAAAQAQAASSSYCYSSFPQTRLTFDDEFSCFGPDAFSTLQRCLKEDGGNPSLKQVVSLLRLSKFDAEVFYKFRQTLLDKISAPFASEKLQRDIKMDLAMVYEQYFPLNYASPNGNHGHGGNIGGGGNTKDIAFEIGRLHMSMKDYQGAIRYFHASLRDCGQHHVTYYNLGLSHYYLHQLDKALEQFEQSLLLNSEYGEAREWQERVYAMISDSTMRMAVAGAAGGGYGAAPPTTALFSPSPAAAATAGWNPPAAAAAASTLFSPASSTAASHLLALNQAGAEGGAGAAGAAAAGAEYGSSMFNAEAFDAAAAAEQEQQQQHDPGAAMAGEAASLAARALQLATQQQQQEVEAQQQEQEQEYEQYEQEQQDDVEEQEQQQEEEEQQQQQEYDEEDVEVDSFTGVAAAGAGAGAGVAAEQHEHEEYHGHSHGPGDEEHHGHSHGPAPSTPAAAAAGAAAGAAASTPVTAAAAAATATPSSAFRTGGFFGLFAS